jgi:hypothetical protein
LNYLLNTYEDKLNAMDLLTVELDNTCGKLAANTDTIISPGNFSRALLEGNKHLSDPNQPSAARWEKVTSHKNECELFY